MAIEEPYVGGIWVPIISDILGREIVRGKVLIGLYDPAVHWLSFILTLASTVLLQGHVVNVMTTNTPPSEIRRSINRAVPKLKESEVGNRLVISDMYTWRTGGKSNELETVESLSLGKVNVEFAAWRGRSPSFDFVVAEDMSAFMRYNEERVFIQWLDKWIGHFREMKGIRLYGFIKRFHSDAMYAYLESSADGIIELDYRENAGVLEHVVRVKSMKGMPHPTDWRRLTVNSNGFMELTT